MVLGLVDTFESFVEVYNASGAYRLVTKVAASV
jgi:hypothetical protein